MRIINSVLAATAAMMLVACDAGPRAHAGQSESNTETPETYSVADRQVAAEDLRLLFQRASGPGAERAVVHGDGTVIRRDREQFRVDGDTVQDLLDLLDEAGFDEFESYYGHGRRIVLAIVDLEAGDYEKVSLRRYYGGEDDPVRPLVSQLLERLEDLEGGIQIDDLSEGLELLRSGELSPKALGMVVRHQPDGGKGWQFTVSEGEATWRAISPDGELAEPRAIETDPEWFGQLARSLQDEEFLMLPRNILVEGARNQLSLAILGQRKTIAARDFNREPTPADEEDASRLKRLLAQVQALSAQDRDQS